MEGNLETTIGYRAYVGFRVPLAGNEGMERGVETAAVLEKL